MALAWYIDYMTNKIGNNILNQLGEAIPGAKVTTSQNSGWVSYNCDGSTPKTAGYCAGDVNVWVSGNYVSIELYNGNDTIYRHVERVRTPSSQRQLTEVVKKYYDRKCKLREIINAMNAMNQNWSQIH